MVAKSASRGSANAGMAGVEFALLSPVLLVLFLGAIDISNALLTARRLGTTAGMVAEIVTTSAVQAQSLNILTDQQAWQATTAAFANFPTWTDPVARRSFAIAVTNVAFTAVPAGCTQKCSYTPEVVWSVANSLGDPRLRPCGPITVVPNNDGASYSTLPVGNVGPTSLIVADVSYTFRPLFFGFLIGNIPMIQSAYVSPRINNETTLVITGAPVVSVNCTGAR